jgi:hypothetical protein
MLLSNVPLAREEVVARAFSDAVAANANGSPQPGLK